MRLSPRDPFMGLWYVELGDVEIGAGRNEAAIEAYQKALDRGYHYYDVFLNMAAGYALEGKMNRAKSALAEARRLNPSLTVKWYVEHTMDLPLRTERDIAQGRAARRVSALRDGVRPNAQPSPRPAPRRGGCQRNEAGFEASLRERVRCSSLVDWPVYPRFGRTRLTSARTRNAGRRSAPGGSPRFRPWRLRASGAGASGARPEAQAMDAGTAGAIAMASNRPGAFLRRGVEHR